MATHLTIALEEGSAEGFYDALGVVARSRGMGEIARESGLKREALYRALRESGNPRFSTVLGVVEALGLRLAVKAREPEPAE